MPQKSSGLELYEVALIKAMLNRGMANKDIQFYFNRPQRAVNSGRITEIKQGLRWPDVQAATNEEVNIFLKEVHKPESQDKVFGIYLPRQLESATVFRITSHEKIELVPDPPNQTPENSADQRELYDELRHKVEQLLGNNHNLLGPLLTPLQRFLEALPENIMIASVSRIWSRGNTLRSVLRAHDRVKSSNDFHPDKLDAACGERLQDVVEGFNIFILGDPKGCLFDSKKFGPEERAAANEALGVAQPFVRASNEVAEVEASQILIEQYDVAQDADDTINGDQAVALARDTSANFVITAARGAYGYIKRVIGSEISFAWEKVRSAIYTKLGGLLLTAGSSIVTFIVVYGEAMLTFAQKAIHNPLVYQIIELVVKVFS